MFVIHPRDAADWQHAMFIMSHYLELSLDLFSDAEEASSTYMVVDHTPAGFEWATEEEEMIAQHSLRMAETAFQMNWHQAHKSNFRCVHCDALPEPLRGETCGHLTFNRIINPAF